MNTHQNKNKTEEQILKQGFKAGVTMACLSIGVLDTDEDTPKLNQFINQLYSEFQDILKHNKEKNNGQISDIKADSQEA